MPRVLAFLEKELVNVIALSSANEGIVCHKLDGDTYDTGVCTRLVKYARRNQARNVAFDVITCVAGYVCYSSCKVNVGVVCMGICQRDIQRSSFYVSVNIRALELMVVRLEALASAPFLIR